MDPTVLLYPIETAPHPDQDPVPLLLYCPDEGRWLLGLWSEGAWRLQGHAAHVLDPSHWLPVSTDLVVESTRQQNGARRVIRTSPEVSGRRKTENPARQRHRTGFPDLSEEGQPWRVARMQTGPARLRAG